MAYGDFNNLAGRTTSDKILCNKAFKFAGDRKYDGYQCGLVSLVYKFFKGSPNYYHIAYNDFIYSITM